MRGRRSSSAGGTPGAGFRISRSPEQHAGPRHGPSRYRPDHRLEHGQSRRWTVDLDHARTATGVASVKPRPSCSRPTATATSGRGIATPACRSACRCGSRVRSRRFVFGPVLINSPSRPGTRSSCAPLPMHPTNMVTAGYGRHLHRLGSLHREGDRVAVSDDEGFELLDTVTRRRLRRIGCSRPGTAAHDWFRSETRGAGGVFRGTPGGVDHLAVPNGVRPRSSRHSVWVASTRSTSSTAERT